MGRYVAGTDAEIAGGAGTATETRYICRGSPGEAVPTGGALVREDLLGGDCVP